MGEECNEKVFFLFMSHPSMTLHGVLVPAGYIMHLGDNGTYMTACYIGPGMCFGSSPPSPPPTHIHTHTHTKEKSIRMFGSKNWMLNMLSKTHFNNYTMQKKKNHEANTNHKHGLRKKNKIW
jgi:hypothetical protein